MKAIKLFLVILFGMVMVACGGGGSTSSTPTSTSSSGTLTGVAATGSPVLNATVTLKDAAGNIKTSTTDPSSGAFNFNIDNLTPPFLLSVNAGGPVLYSYANPAVSNTAPIANLNPFASVVLQAYYTAQGTNVAAVFGGTLSSAADFPTTPQLALLVTPVVTNLQTYLSNASVTNPTQFSPFTTTFTADGTGFDQVLDRTTLNNNLLGFTVDNGSGSSAGPISSAVTLTATAGSGSTLGSVVVNSTTTNGGITSSSQQSVPVGTTIQQTDLAAAENGVLALFNNLSQLVASKGSGITTADVTPYIDANYLDQGDTQSALATQLAGALSSTLSSSSTVTIYRINKFIDGSTQYLDATIEIQDPIYGLAFMDDNDNVNVGMVFKKEANGNWAFYGQQTIASAHVGLQDQYCYGCSGSTPVNSQTMMAQVQTTTGLLSSASVTGSANSLPADYCTNNPSTFTQSSVALALDTGTYNGGDRWDLPCWVNTNGNITGTLPSAGTIYTFSLIPTGSSIPVISTDSLNSATNDHGDVTAINGTPLATFLGNNTVSNVAGTQLTVTYTLPTTYPVLYTYLSGFCQNATEISGGGGADINGDAGSIPPGTTSGTITIPTQCDGSATAGANINVWFVGINGEKSMVNVIF